MTSQSDRQARRSRRAQRRIEAERAARRRRQLTIFGSLAGVALVLALILILANRPDGADDISGIQAAAPLDPSIPTNGRVMGNADAPVQVVEWGDYQ